MTKTPNQNPQSQHDHESAEEQKPISPRLAVVGLILLLIVALLLGGLGILRRTHADTVLAERTQELAAPTVTVAAPKTGAPTDSFVLPGNVAAFTDSPIYARTSGYLTRWYYDIGSRVKKGALLAVIASPEVDQQLAQAQADLATAQAELPGLHERVCAVRNGMVSLSLFRSRRRYRDAASEVGGLGATRFTLHRDASGAVDGLLGYRTKLDWTRSTGPRGDLQVEELWASTEEAEASLWRFCLQHDLMTRVTANWRPSDEAFAVCLANPRAWRQTLSDGLWLRPLDPAALLSGRRYGREDGLVLEVHEPDGAAPRRFRLEGGLEGAICVPSSASPDLSLGVAALGSICLGDTPLERLHRAGRVEEVTPGAVARATAMFGWSPAPWSGAFF